MQQSTTGLENLTLWLWDNEDDGLHITMTTNYNLPTEKRWFFSYAGAQAKNSWRAYDRNQPENFKNWFAAQKDKYRDAKQQGIDTGYTVYISKQARNTGLKGRAVAQGFCMTFMPENLNKDNPQFILQMGDFKFVNEFDPTALSESQRQKGCLGVYRWQAQEENIQGVNPW